MDQALAPSLAPSPTIVFRDGLGERRRVTDPTGRESVDLWYVSSELSGAALEAALRDRVKRLASFEHPSVNHVHSVDRVNNGATLAVISESAIGVRLADLLASAEKHHLSLDISAALCVIRQYLPAIAALLRPRPRNGPRRVRAGTPGHHAGRAGDCRRPRDGRRARAPALLARAVLEGSPRRAAALGGAPAFRSPRRRHAGRPRRAVADPRPRPDRRGVPDEGARAGRDRPGPFRRPATFSRCRPSCGPGCRGRSRSISAARSPPSRKRAPSSSGCCRRSATPPTRRAWNDSSRGIRKRPARSRRLPHPRQRLSATRGRRRPLRPCRGPVPVPPRADPSLRVESPRAEPAPRVEAPPRLAAVPRVESAACASR